MASTGANEHLATGTTTVGPDAATADVVVVAVHGRDQSPDYMVEHLVERVLAQLDGDASERIAWLLPAAAGGSWYPNGFLAPIAANQPWLDHALEAVRHVEDGLAARDPGTVLWCGFSQGGCLVAEYIARAPESRGVRRGGLAVLTGAMIGPPDVPLVVDGDLAGLPAYFGVGDDDEWVPAWRVSDTVDAYAAAGAAITHEVFPGRAHEISDAEITAVCALLVPLLDRPGHRSPVTEEG